MRVLGQVAAATSTERIWSVMGYLHNARRNRLSVEQCTNLTFCYSNVRLRDRVSDLTYEEKHFEWD